MEQIEGRAFIALSGPDGSKNTPGSMLYKAEDINCPHIVPVPRAENPEMPAVRAMLRRAAACRVPAGDPLANTCDTQVTGLAAESVFNDGERQKLPEAGTGTNRIDITGNVPTERPITSYTENTGGERDTYCPDTLAPEGRAPSALTSTPKRKNASRTGNLRARKKTSARA